MTLTKASLLKAISDTSNFLNQESISALESLLEIIKRTLASGEDVLISGFGKFCIKEKKQRKGRNPQTGDDMMMDTRRITTFKCSNILRDRINDKG